MRGLSLRKVSKNMNLNLNFGTGDTVLTAILLILLVYRPFVLHTLMFSSLGKFALLLGLIILTQVGSLYVALLYALVLMLLLHDVFETEGMENGDEGMDDEGMDDGAEGMDDGAEGMNNEGLEENLEDESMLVGADSLSGMESFEGMKNGANSKKNPLKNVMEDPDILSKDPNDVKNLVKKNMPNQNMANGQTNDSKIQAATPSKMKSNTEPFIGGLYP